MKVQNWTLPNTEDRQARIERLRKKLKASGRKVDIDHGIVATTSVFDEALKALEKELDIEEEDAKWDASFAHSQDFLQSLADEARAEYAAGLTDEFDSDAS